MMEPRARGFAFGNGAVFALAVNAGALRALGQGAAGTPPDAVPPIRDIEPPLDVFPYPLWQVALAAGLALTVTGAVIWLVGKWLRNRPAPLPPTPREIALAGLREAEGKLDTLEPHAFSILVSDILRRYVAAQFGLRAREQTSPEFLAGVAGSARFSAEEKALLGEFLSRCDVIKFANVAATRAESAALLAQAREFVEHAALTPGQAGAVPPPLPAAAIGGTR